MTKELNNELFKIKATYEQLHRYTQLTKKEGSEAILKFPAIGGTKSESVSKECMQRLSNYKEGEETYLSDSIVNCLLWMLQNDLDSYGDVKDKILICPSTIYAMLKGVEGSFQGLEIEERHQRVLNIFKHKKWRLESYEKCFFPINGGKHWWLLVVLMKKKEIIIYDSFPSGSEVYDQNMGTILDFFVFYHNEEGISFKATDWEKSGLKSSPPQQGYVNCGIHVIMNADYEARGYPVDYKIDTNYNQHMRTYVAFSIDKKKLYTRFKFLELMKDIKREIKGEEDPNPNVYFSALKEKMFSGDIETAKKLYASHDDSMIR